LFAVVELVNHLLKTAMTGWIGISMGDVTGIGLEVTLKALAAEGRTDSSTRYLLIGDAGYAQRLNGELKLNLPLQPYTTPDAAGQFFIYNPLTKPLAEGLVPGSPGAAEAALAWLTEAGQRCLQQDLDAMVTSPVNKESILLTGQPFIGQTEYLSQLARSTRTAMMLLGSDDRGNWLRVVLATTHLPLKLVATSLRQEKIELAIELAGQACRDLRLSQARVGVCGLNPHAGEGGELGTEEITMIGPAVQAMQQRGIEVRGPFPADTLFYYAYRGAYDVVVAMYHDQGLVPLKMIGFENGVNWTLGLPFIRTSPDHGTAYDIVGKGVANPSSMIAALRLAKDLARHRS
jgi:4-hydroxythreonine-4-phosphate dehydrogenase